MDFEAGGVYVNRLGEYEVLRRNGDSLYVRYVDGTEAELSATVQARIASNMALEAASLAPFTAEEQNERFFENVGYLASHATLIEGFSPAESVAGFSRIYEQLTGRSLASEPTFYRHGTGADKWGVELRIEYSGSLPTPFLGFGASPVGSPKGVETSRINNNALLRRLFSIGFVFGTSQDLKRIRDRIPPKYRDAFDLGAGE